LLKVAGWFAIFRMVAVSPFASPLTS